MDNPIERIIAWYEKRFDQEYNAELTHTLLREEYHEWLNSEDDIVNELKELCDIFFVSVGAIWKLGDYDLEAQQESEKFAVQVRNLIPSTYPGFLIGGLIDQHAIGMVPIPQYWLHCINELALTQMQCLGLTPEQCHKAILAVCDSNDTKSIAKIPSDQKYSDEGKGEFFRPAEPALRKLLEEAGCLSKTH